MNQSSFLNAVQAGSSNFSPRRTLKKIPISVWDTMTREVYKLCDVDVEEINVQGGLDKARNDGNRVHGGLSKVSEVTQNQH